MFILEINKKNSLHNLLYNFEEKTKNKHFHRERARDS
jgi:hypothetical protein